jgi:hypothetical protein
MPAPTYIHQRPDATYQVHDGLTQVITTWSNRTDVHGRGTKSGPTGESQVRDALGMVEGALTKLGNRNGTREDAARAWLEGQRAQLSKSLTVWESIARDCDGPAVTELVARLESATAAEDEARFAYEYADPENVLKCRADLDVAIATVRKVARDFAKLVADARLPALPDPSVFGTAEENTRQLVLLGRCGQPMTALHTALDMGASASPDVALLWIVFESGAAGELFTMRHARFEEEHARPEAVEAAE